MVDLSDETVEAMNLGLKLIAKRPTNYALTQDGREIVLSGAYTLEQLKAMVNLIEYVHFTESNQ